MVDQNQTRALMKRLKLHWVLLRLKKRTVEKALWVKELSNLQDLFLFLLVIGQVVISFLFYFYFLKSTLDSMISRFMCQLDDDS